MYDFGKLEEQALALHAHFYNKGIKRREQTMITTAPIGTLYRLKTNGALLMKYSANGDPHGVIWCVGLHGTYKATVVEVEEISQHSINNYILHSLKAKMREQIISVGAPVQPESGKSDGSSADYYKLPAGATQLQDLISHRNMNAQIGEIFRAAYRYGAASHSDQLRDAKKIKFYIEAEIQRLEKQV